jgi:photosynthetic reaction center cytochrome c subunit
MANWIIDTPAIHPNNDYVHRHSSTGIMLAMTNHMADTWTSYVLPRADLAEVEEEALPHDNRQYYVSLDDKTFALPGCYTCHRGYTIPAATVTKEFLETQTDGGLTILPPMLRGLEEESAHR